MKSAAQAAAPKIDWQRKVDVAVVPPRLDRKEDWLLEVGREKPAAQQSLGEKTGLIVRFEK